MDPGDSLASQPGLIEELQANERPCLKTAKWIAPWERV